MPISFIHRLIFIHIPKTAGTTIGMKINKLPQKKFWEQLLLNGYDEKKNKHLQHFTYMDLLEYCSSKKYDVNKFTFFAVVRNPFDRIISDFYFSFNTVLKTPIRETDLDLLQKKFADFLDDFLSDNGNKFDYHEVPQYKYLIDEKGEIPSKIKIFKFETLAQDFETLGIGKLDIHINMAKNKKYNYRDYFNDVTYKKVLDFYREDFIRFGYSTSL
jgi:hypothetical protein